MGQKIHLASICERKIEFFCNSVVLANVYDKGNSLNSFIKLLAREYAKRMSINTCRAQTREHTIIISRHTYYIDSTDNTKAELDKRYRILSRTMSTHV